MKRRQLIRQPTDEPEATCRTNIQGKSMPQATTSHLLLGQQNQPEPLRDTSVHLPPANVPPVSP